MPWRLKWKSVCGLEVNRKDCATLASWQTATARPTTLLLRCGHMGTPPLKRKSVSTMHTRGWVLPSSRSHRRKALGAKAEASSPKKLPSTFSTNIDWLSWATFQTLRQWERWCLQHCFIWWAQTSPPSQPLSHRTGFLVLLQQGHCQEWRASPPCPRNPVTTEARRCRTACARVPEMADPSLLKRWAKGKMQNANECLHSVIWSKCPKTVFVGKRRVEGAVASAVSSFNIGATQLTQVMERLGAEPSVVSNSILESMDTSRIVGAKHQMREAFKDQRKIQSGQAKHRQVQQERGEGPTYASGSFWRWTDARNCGNALGSCNFYTEGQTKLVIFMLYMNGKFWMRFAWICVLRICKSYCSSGLCASIFTFCMCVLWVCMDAMTEREKKLIWVFCENAAAFYWFCLLHCIDKSFCV